PAVAHAGVVLIGRGRTRRVCREQFHAALWAVTRLIADHLRMHRTCVGGHRGGLAGEQFHAAFGTAAGLCACDIGMHRTCVGGHRGGLADEQLHAPVRTAVRLGTAYMAAPAASGIAAGSSICAINAKILSGAAASQRSSWARSASSSGAPLTCPN